MSDVTFRGVATPKVKPRVPCHYKNGQDPILNGAGLGNMNPKSSGLKGPPKEWFLAWRSLDSGFPQCPFGFSRFCFKLPKLVRLGFSSPPAKQKERISSALDEDLGAHRPAAHRVPLLPGQRGRFVLLRRLGARGLGMREGPVGSWSIRLIRKIHSLAKSLQNSQGVIGWSILFKHASFQPDPFSSWDSKEVF